VDWKVAKAKAQQGSQIRCSMTSDWCRLQRERRATYKCRWPTAIAS
jgi:hypothetical protein